MSGTTSKELAPLLREAFDPPYVRQEQMELAILKLERRIEDKLEKISETLGAQIAEHVETALGKRLRALLASLWGVVAVFGGGLIYGYLDLRDTSREALRVGTENARRLDARGKWVDVTTSAVNQLQHENQRRDPAYRPILLPEERPE